MPTRSHLSVAAALLAAAALIACGGDDDGIAFEGQPGTQVDALYPGWIPQISAGIGAADHPMLVDSGAPVTIFDRDSFPALGADGKHNIELHAFALTFPGYTGISYDIFGDPPGSGAPEGIVGGDLLRHFALRLDYQGGHAALYYGDDPPPGDDTIVVAGGETLAILVLGGGDVYLPGDCPPAPYCGSIHLSPTRIVLPARFEGAANTEWVLVDTGASAVATSESFLASLAGNGSTRPRLDGVTIVTANGLAQAALSRIDRVELGGDDPPARAANTSIALDDLPVLVLPNDQLLQGISNEVGRPIVALVGGTFLREFQTTIDYRNHQMVLEKYRSRAHIPAGEYVGVGFTLVSADGGTWQVADVYTGTDAASEGLSRGDVVEEISGQSITGLARASVDALFDGFAIGQDVPVGVLVNGAVVTKQVAIEDLLPSYPAP